MRPHTLAGLVLLGVGALATAANAPFTNCPRSSSLNSDRARGSGMSANACASAGSMSSG